MNACGSAMIKVANCENIQPLSLVGSVIQVNTDDEVANLLLTRVHSYSRVNECLIDCQGLKHDDETCLNWRLTQIMSISSLRAIQGLYYGWSPIMG